jgi:hypothetical protein
MKQEADMFIEINVDDIPTFAVEDIARLFPETDEDTAFSLQSAIAGISQAVQIAGNSSENVAIFYGVPLASVLAIKQTVKEKQLPLLFGNIRRDDTVSVKLN